MYIFHPVCVKENCMVTEPYGIYAMVVQGCTFVKILGACSNFIPTSVSDMLGDDKD